MTYDFDKMIFDFSIPNDKWFINLTNHNILVEVQCLV